MPAKTRKTVRAKKEEEEKETPVVAVPDSSIEKKLNSLSAVVDALQATVESLKANVRMHDAQFLRIQRKMSGRVR